MQTEESKLNQVPLVRFVPAEVFNPSGYSRHLTTGVAPPLHILRELRYRTRPAPAFLGRNKKKDERLSKYERHVPFQWKQAILRDAPLLKGFFAEEPKWREKMLRWCDRQLEVLASLPSLDGKNGLIGNI